VAVINGYLTEVQFRDELADTGAKLDQSLIEKAINATSRGIDRFCGRRFWQDPNAVPRVYRPKDPYEVLVDDISTATGLVVATDTGGDGSWATVWNAADYQLEPLNSDAEGGAFSWTKITAIGGRTFPVGGLRPTLRAITRFGWSALPDDVNEAAVLRSVALFRRKEAPFGVAGFGEFGAVRITRRDPDVLELLEPYVRITRPDI
jgi:hypothetical protein